MHTIQTTLKATVELIRNKLVAFVFLALSIIGYLLLPTGPEHATPFAELLYAVILVQAVICLAPIIRLLVFPEAASYAESGELKRDLDEPGFPPVLIHYWFATATAYLVTLLCVSSLLRL